MRYLRERLNGLLMGVFCLLLGVSCGNPSAEPATVDEAAWFDGAWTVGPAPVEGMETIVPGKPQNSVIRHLEGNKIEREITLRGTLHVMQFEVQAFGGNFPW